MHRVVIQSMLDPRVSGHEHKRSVDSDSCECKIASFNIDTFHTPVGLNDAPFVTAEVLDPMEGICELVHVHSTVGA